MMRIGDNIRYFRKKKGMTQKELSISLCVTQQAVQRWESDVSVPQADRLQEISDFLDIPTALLLDPESKIDDDHFTYLIPIDDTELMGKDIQEYQRKIMDGTATFADEIMLSLTQEKLNRNPYHMFLLTAKEYNLYKAILQINPDFTNSDFEHMMMNNH